MLARACYQQMLDDACHSNAGAAAVVPPTLTLPGKCERYALYVLLCLECLRKLVCLQCFVLQQPAASEQFNEHWVVLQQPGYRSVLLECTMRCTSQHLTQCCRVPV